MSIHSLQTAFNAGELTPSMDARVGVEKYANGCRRMKNAIAAVHGPAVKRPGMEWLDESNTQTYPARLIGLNFSATTSFIVEMGSGTFYFWTNGAQVAETLAHPYKDEELNEVQFAQVNDVIYLTHANHFPRVLERYADDDWRLRELHQPATGWTLPSNATPATGNAILHRWFPAPLTVNTLAAADTYLKAAPGQSVPLSGAPQGTGNNWPASIQRVQGYFVCPASGTYKFRSNSVDDQARIKLNSTAYGPESGAATILSSTTVGATTTSAGFAMVAGSAYWMEFLLNDRTRPSVGTFTYLKDDVLQGLVTPDLLAAHLIGQSGTLLTGWPALLDENITETTLTPSGTSGSITLTASAALWETGHVGAWWEVAHRRENSFVEIVSAEPVISAATSSSLRVIGSYTVYSYGTWESVLYLEELQADGSTWKVIRSWRSNLDRNVIDTGTAEREATLRLRIAAGTSAPASPAAVPRFLLEAGDSKVYGLVRITGITSDTVATADVYSPLESTAATELWTEGAWSAVQGHPRSVCLHQQRVNFGGTVKRPQSIWGSVTADFENFRRSTLDDGSFLYQIASEKSFLIQWMVSQGDLIIGTSLDEWLASSPENAAVTPTNLTFRRQSAYGSAYIQAELINETVVFVQRNFIKMRRMIYRDTGRYGAADLSVLSSHLFASGVRQFAWQSQVQSILWVVMEDGRLLGMTFEEEQNVFAWHEHTTDGEIRSVAAIHGPQGDEVWFVVDREGVYSIERFDPRTLFSGTEGDTTARRCYVDAAVLKESTEAMATLTGLDHLEGRTVSILADGAQQPDQEVVGGEITLDPEASVVCAGLPYTFEVQPMKMEASLNNGTSQGRRHALRGVMLRVIDSLGGSVADYPGATVEEIQYRTVEMPMDAPPPTFTGDIHMSLWADHRDAVDIIITHNEPLPFTLAGMVVKVDIFDE